MIEWSMTVVDSDGAEHDIHVQAPSLRQAVSDAIQEAVERGIQATGAFMVDMEVKGL